MKYVKHDNGFGIISRTLIFPRVRIMLSRSPGYLGLSWRRNPPSK